jgi:hexulose-6-phosphate isomerase
MQKIGYNPRIENIRHHRGIVMPPSTVWSRREFVGRGLWGPVLPLAMPLIFSPSVSRPAFAENQGRNVSLAGRVYKTLKLGMVKVGGSLEEKFLAAKSAGFAGIEMPAPGLNVEETTKAIRATDMIVDGTVISTHWSVRHSDPDAKVRKVALNHLKESLQKTHAVGGHTTLLVVGHGKDGSPKEVWDRSLENISKAIPLAAELGVVIAIENVWNHFLYDHQGDSNQSAERFVTYLDQLNSPWVGMQFDIGNHWKYGSTGDWIRSLGHRIVKLDAKGFSRQQDTFTKIGEGDVDWADVRRALREINFYGWCAAEVDGGDAARLREISKNLDRAFLLG